MANPPWEPGDGSPNVLRQDDDAHPDRAQSAAQHDTIDPVARHEPRAQNDLVAAYLEKMRHPSPALQEEGLRDIYAFYSGRLRYWIKSQVSCSDTVAEEAAAEALYQAWRAISAGRLYAMTGPQLSAWLMKCASRYAKQVCRKLSKTYRRTLPRSFEDFYAALELNGSRIPEKLTQPDTAAERIDVAVQQLTLRHALRRLSPSERLCIWRYAQGYSSLEIAEELGPNTSEGTVRVHICRARKKLMEALRSNSDHSPTDDR